VPLPVMTLKRAQPGRRVSEIYTTGVLETTGARKEAA
jgi:hypothetical protein